MVEEWRPVVGTREQYEVSSLGWIRSWKAVKQGKKKPRILKQSIVKQPKQLGYKQVSISPDKNKKRSYKVHLLVCHAFHGPRPKGHQASHLNGKCTDNRASNLKWETPWANNARRLQHGTLRNGEKHPNAKLSDDDVCAIRSLRKRGYPYKFISKLFGLYIGSTQAICSGRRRKSKTYKGKKHGTQS